MRSKRRNEKKKRKIGNDNIKRLWNSWASDTQSIWNREFQSKKSWTKKNHNLFCFSFIHWRACSVLPTNVVQYNCFWNSKLYSLSSVTSQPEIFRGLLVCAFFCFLLHFQTASSARFHFCVIACRQNEQWFDNIEELLRYTQWIWQWLTNQFITYFYTNLVTPGTQWKDMHSGTKQKNTSTWSMTLKPIDMICELLNDKKTDNNCSMKSVDGQKRRPAWKKRKKNLSFGIAQHSQW